MGSEAECLPSMCEALVSISPSQNQKNEITKPSPKGQHLVPLSPGESDRKRRIANTNVPQTCRLLIGEKKILRKQTCFLYKFSEINHKFRIIMVFLLKIFWCTRDKAPSHICSNSKKTPESFEPGALHHFCW